MSEAVAESHFPVGASSLLVVFEGTDGSGKSTAARAFVRRLVDTGVPAHLHPNRSYRPIREALDRVAREEGLRDRHELFGSDASYLMASATKWRELLTMTPRLTEPGHVVVVDRYIWSHLALAQVWGASNGNLVRRMFEELPRPDVTFLLDLDPETAAARVRSRGEDINDIAFLARFRVAFHALPEAKDFFVIDAAPSASFVADEVVRRFREFCLTGAEGGITR